MKKLHHIFFSVFFSMIGFGVLAQDAHTTPCDQFHLDFETGLLNGMSGTASMTAVKQKFPCFTGETVENQDGINCGGGVFYLEHGFFVYTAKDCITVRGNFNGKMTKPVLGQPFANAMELMGTPNGSFDYTDDFLGEKTSYLQYSKDWGTLVLLINEDGVQSIEMHYGKKIGEIDFCF